MAEESSLSNTGERCPHCDAVFAPGASHCLMCGKVLPGAADTILTVSENIGSEPATATAVAPDPESVIQSMMREKEAPVTFWMTAVFAVIIIVLGALVLRFQDPNITVAMVPTTTATPITPTFTPTITPLPTSTDEPTATPTITLTPAPTATPQPDLEHNVAAGETLIGLALRYRVSVASIAQANGFSADTGLQEGQTIFVPWPTPTPPLVPVGIEVNGESVIAEPAGCPRHEVRSGESVASIANQYVIEFLDLFLAVNRLTEDSVLQPGDTLCIPEIIYGGNLPPTPGPSPTPSLTPAPVGPSLLFPVDGAEIEPPDRLVTLQWTAVKDLAENEWYMVELVDMDLRDTSARRGFTRDTSFQAPSSWRPVQEAAHQMRWRVQIVQVTAWRADGMPIYEFGGQLSAPAFFTWMGAIPTPTPPPTATPTATAAPTNG
ncbi:MAG: LysM peptidoglycan-binding domain-containing protein [Anaerolineae bacterium]